MPCDSSTADTPSPSENEESVAELFQIIDESGEGFGFDLTPEALFRPVLIGTGTLFGVGMLAGVPIGIAMGRSAEESGRRGNMAKAPVRPSFDGLKFAATTFGLGTLLCASVGVAGFYAVKWYYDVETFEQFGQVMRKAVPSRRSQMEAGLSPILQSVRQTAGDGVPPFALRWRTRLENSRLGKWVKKQVDESVNIIDSDDQLQQQPQPLPKEKKT